MNLLLTSDFPSTPNDAVVQRIRSTGRSPRVAWLPPLSAEGHSRFQVARAAFQAVGVSDVEYCDIDEEPDQRQLDSLDRYDVLYLTGGDPLVFRQTILLHGLRERFRAYLDTGRLIVAASGGAMQFTRNVSLYRLLANSVEDVIAQRDAYEAIGIVNYELLPHLNCHTAEFLESVKRYSERVQHEIIAINDGAALLHDGSSEFQCDGRAMRFLRGHQSLA